MLFVKVLGHLGRLAEFAVHAQGAHMMVDSRLRQSVGNLRAHPADHLVVFNGDDAARAFLDCRADGLHIHSIDEGIGNDGRGHALLLQLATRFDRPAHQRPAGDDDHVVPGGQNLRLAPFIIGDCPPSELDNSRGRQKR